MQLEPYVQFTDAVVTPQFDRKEQWWILSRIEQAMGLDSVLNNPQYDPYGRINKMLSYADLSVKKLKTFPRQAAVLPKSETGRFYTDWLQTEDKKVDCCPSIFSGSIETAHNIFQELSGEPEDQLKLISLRNGFMHNSWYQNLLRLKKGEHRSNPVYMNPADAQKRGLASGSKVRMSNQWGRIETKIKIDDRLRQGVVAMAHGWGNKKTPGMTVANQYPGVNVNQLLALRSRQL